MTTALIRGYEPNRRQLDAARACLDPTARVVVLDGAIRSGKTQAAARLLVEFAVAGPATYLVGRATYRIGEAERAVRTHGCRARWPLGEGRRHRVRRESEHDRRNLDPPHSSPPSPPTRRFALRSAQSQENRKARIPGGTLARTLESPSYGHVGRRKDDSSLVHGSR